MSRSRSSRSAAPSDVVVLSCARVGSMTPPPVDGATSSGPAPTSRKRSRKLSPYQELVRGGTPVELAIHLLRVQVLSDATWMDRAVSMVGEEAARRQKGESRAQRIERILLAGASPEELAAVEAAVSPAPVEPVSLVKVAA